MFFCKLNVAYLHHIYSYKLRGMMNRYIRLLLVLSLTILLFTTIPVQAQVEALQVPSVEVPANVETVVRQDVSDLSSARFAVIGDYGLAGPAELDVANQVKSWNPIMTIFFHILASMEQAQVPIDFSRSLEIMIGLQQMPSLILTTSRFQEMSVITTLFRDRCISLCWIVILLNLTVSAKHQFKLFG